MFKATLKKNQLKKYVWLLALLPFFSLRAEFVPARHVYGGQSLYMQVSSLQELTEKFKTFYHTLREKNAMPELDSIDKNLKEKMGLNFLDTEQLKKSGVDTQTPLIVSTNRLPDKFKNITNLNKENILFDIYLPAHNSQQLFDKIIALQVSEEIDHTTGEMIRRQKGKKINKNVYAKSDEKFQLYVVRADDFIHITNDAQKLIPVPPSNLAWEKDPLYQEWILQKQKLNEQLPSGVIQILLSPSVARTKLQLSKPMGESLLQLLHEYNTEITRNMNFSLITIEIDKSGIVADSSSFYSDGYLQNPESKIFDFLTYKVPPAVSDFVGGKSPLLYIKAILQPRLLSSIITSLRKDFSFANQILSDVENALQTNFEKDILPLFSGAVGLRLQELPSLFQLSDILSWKFFLYLSLQNQISQKENAFAKLTTLMEGLAAYLNESETNSLNVSQFSYSQSKIWALNKSEQKNSESLFSVILSKDDLILSGNVKHVKEIKQKSNSSLQDSVLKKNVNEEDFFSFFFLDVSKLNQYLKQEIENSPVLFRFGQVLDYVKNISSVYAYTQREENQIKGRFVLKLN